VEGSNAREGGRDRMELREGVGGGKGGGKTRIMKGRGVQGGEGRDETTRGGMGGG